MFYSIDRVKGLFAAINGISPGFQFRGAWNADTNSPTLASGVGSQGDTYIVSVAGTTTLDGNTDWEIGDFAVFGLSTWSKVDNTESTLDNLVLLPTGLTNISATNLNSVNYTQAGASTTLQIPGAETFTPGTRFDLVRFSTDDVTIQAESPVILNGITGGSFSLRENNARVTLVKIANPNSWQLNFWQDLQDGESVNILPTGTVTLTDSYINSVNVNQTGALTTLEIPNSETYRNGTKFDILKLENEIFSVGVDTLININGANSPIAITDINDRATLIKVEQPHNWQLNFWQLDVDSSTLQSAYDIGDGTITQVPAGAKPLVFDDVTISNVAPATIHASGTAGFLTVTNMSSVERDAVIGQIAGHLNLNSISDKLQFRSSTGWSTVAVSLSNESFASLFINSGAGLITTINSVGMKIQDNPETQSVQITEQSVTLDNALMKSTGPSVIHASGTAGFLTVTNMSSAERDAVSGQVIGHLNINSVSDVLEFRHSTGWLSAAVSSSDETFTSLFIFSGGGLITNIDSTGIKINDFPETGSNNISENGILINKTPATEETEILYNSVEVRDDDLTNRAQILKNRIRLFSPTRTVFMDTTAGLEVNNAGEVTQVTEFGLSGTNLVIESTNDTDFTPGGSLLINGGNFFEGVAPTTTKGDLIVHNNAGANVRFPVGPDGNIPIADSTQPEGIRWGAVTAAITDDSIVNLPSGTTQLTASIIDNVYINDPSAFTELQIPSTEVYAIGTKFEAIKENNQTFVLSAQAPKNINGFGGTQIVEQYSRAIVTKVSTNNWRLSYAVIEDTIVDLEKAYQNGAGTINVLSGKPFVAESVSVFATNDGDTSMRVSGITGFFRPTNMNNAQRNALTPENGAQNYGFDSGKLEVRSLGTWRDVAYSDTDETFNTLTIDNGGGLISSITNSGINVNPGVGTNLTDIDTSGLTISIGAANSVTSSTGMVVGNFSPQESTQLASGFSATNTGINYSLTSLNGLSMQNSPLTRNAGLTESSLFFSDNPITRTLLISRNGITAGDNFVSSEAEMQNSYMQVRNTAGTSYSIMQNTLTEVVSPSRITKMDSSLGLRITNVPITKVVTINEDGITSNGTLNVASSSLITYNSGNFFDAVAPTTTKGDLIVHNNAGTNVRVPVGTSDNDLFVVDSSTATGLAYKSADQLALCRDIATQISSVTVTNTITETTLFGTQVGSLTIPANSINAGTSFKIKMGGVFENVNTGEEIRVRVYIGATLVCDIGPSTLALIAVPSCFQLEVDNITIRGTGVSASTYSYAVLKICDDNSETIFAIDGSIFNSTVDTTISNIINVTATWETVSVSNIITAHTCTIQRTR